MIGERLGEQLGLVWLLVFVDLVVVQERLVVYVVVGVVQFEVVQGRLKGADAGSGCFWRKSIVAVSIGS